MKEYCQYAETAVARGVTEAPHASQKPQKERGAGEEGKGGRGREGGRERVEDLICSKLPDLKKEIFSFIHLFAGLMLDEKDRGCLSDFFLFKI